MPPASRFWPQGVKKGVKLLAGLPGSPRLWVMLGVACLCAFGFLAVTYFVFDGAQAGAAAPTALDRSIAQYLQQFRSPKLTGRVIEVSALGSAPVLVVFALLAYSIVLRTRDRLGFLHLSIVLLGAGVLSRLLQALFDRGRPEDLLPLIVVTEGSFPSAHLFGATACYATYAFFYARYAPRLRAEVACYVLTCVLVLLIGATRIYLGAHHATDVMAGIAAGAAWAFFVAAVFSLWYRPSGTRAGG
jgi:membrane-associated phospholipid phosphatase